MSSVNRQWRNAMWGGAFVSPWLVGFALLVVYPFAATLYWSFCEFDLLTPPQWVGGRHYARLIDEIRTAEAFAGALWNTGYFALVTVPGSIALGIGLAVVRRVA